jgi:hypothetical protein
MAPSLLSRLRRQSAPGDTGPDLVEDTAPDLPPAPAPAPAPQSVPARAEPPKRRRVAPPASELRRERRALMRVREDRLRDLGGLALEMYRRDRFREDLLVERCTDLIALEARIHELDALLTLSSPLRRSTPVARCECGAPLLAAMNFCATCGRPARPDEAEQRT